MTEAEWLACDDPRLVFEALERGASNRRLLHFCVHCCCLQAGVANPDTSRYRFAKLWRTIERFADGQVTEAKLRTAWNAAGILEGALEVADSDVESPFQPATWARMWVNRDGLGYSISDATVTALFRDIFGNPFRPVALDPAWLSSTVVALAQGIYDERAFDRMPILADALQDAGCTSEDVLSHCRDTTLTHVRGCWVLDLLLGKGH